MRFNISAFQMVPGNVKETAKYVSEFLNSNGVPHAVIGGMAVSAYSPPRMTQDVDFLVPENSLNVIRKLGKVSPLAESVDGVTVTVNEIAVDFIFAPEDMPEETLTSGPKIDGISVLRPEALVLMKMHASRTKDHADVIEMLKSGLIDVKNLKNYVKKYDPSMLDDLESNIMIAEYEKKPGTKRKAKLISGN